MLKRPTMDLEKALQDTTVKDIINSIKATNST